MSLERYLTGRLVVLRPNATVFEAARAMEDNGIGSVLVSTRWGLVGIVTDRDIVTRVVARSEDPRGVTVGDVMSRDVMTLHRSATEADAAHAMRTCCVRRIALVDDDRHPIGIVSLDDLIAQRAIAPSLASEIVCAQLSRPTRRKPAGTIRPGRTHPTPDASGRREARAESTYRSLVHEVQRAARLVDPRHADRALTVVVEAICQRIMPELARHFLSQLPVALKERITRLEGPIRAIGREEVERRIAFELGTDPDTTDRVIEAVAEGLATMVSEGQLETVRNQLPADMRSLLRARGRERMREERAEMERSVSWDWA